MLGLKPTAFAKLFGLTLGQFRIGTRNAKERLARLAEITQKWRLRFARECPDPTGVQLSTRQKRQLAKKLLNRDSDKKYSVHGYKMAPLSKLKVLFSEFLSGCSKLQVADMPLGTPLSPMGNLLTAEFVQLITIDSAILKHIDVVSDAIKIDCREILRIELALHPQDFSVSGWIQAIEKEARDRFVEEQLAAISLHVELAIFKGVLADLRGVEGIKSRLPDEEKKLCVLKDWLVHEFSLSQASYQEVIKSGQFFLKDMRDLQAETPPEGDPRPKDIQIFLTFGDTRTQLKEIVKIITDQPDPEKRSGRK